MKILYFVKGGVPTPEQKVEAERLGAIIRNASVFSGDFVERCDAVAGEVPQAYADLPHTGIGETEPELPEKLLSEMSNKELDAEAERLGVKYPSEVNTKAEKVEYLTAFQSGEQG